MLTTDESAQATALMEQYCDGQASAARGLYTLLAPRMLRFLKSQVGDAATAEDVLHDTFLKVHRWRSRYVRGANPVPWIYAIAHRSGLDEIRRRRRLAARRKGLETLAEEEVSLPPETDEVSRRTAAALDSLPESQRRAVLLLKVHGHSYAEAAALSGTTVPAIRLRAHRAYVALRQILSADLSPRTAVR